MDNLDLAHMEFELAEIFVQLGDYLDDPTLRHIHLKTDHITIFVRRSVRAFTPELGSMMNGRNCLDIADVTIHESYQGHRLFSRFVEYATQVSPYRFLHLECVNNDIIVSYAQRHGWNLRDVNCYWKEIRPEGTITLSEEAAE